MKRGLKKAKQQLEKGLTYSDKYFKKAFILLYNSINQNKPKTKDLIDKNKNLLKQIEKFYYVIRLRRRGFSHIARRSAR